MKQRVTALALCIVAAIPALVETARAAPAASTAAPPTAPHAAPPSAQVALGQSLYASRCAACHDHPRDRIPPRVFITTTRTANDVIDTLTSGVMRAQAAGLQAAEIEALAVYLTGREPASRPAADANRCHSAPRLQLSDDDWRSWGGNLANLRFQPHGLGAAQVPHLRLRWVFAYPGQSTFGQPAVVGGMVLAGGTGGRVFALDAETGCTYWSYDAGALVRTGIVVGTTHSGATAPPTALTLAWFGDDKGMLHAVDAQSGARVWRTLLDEHPMVRLVGTPVLHEGVLYVPVSSLEEVAAADPNYRCCTFRGSLVALDAASGRQLWRSYTVRTPAAPVTTADGRRLAGPAGGAVFSAPTIDPTRGVIYLGTGDSYTDVPTDSTNALIALRLRDGARLWTHQVLKHDAWIMLCEGRPVGNCPSPLGPDFDFASSPLLLQLAGGAERLIAGAKSGIVYGVDPLRQGQLVWQRALAAGTANGAILWAPASDGARVYVATSEYDITKYRGPGALVALDPSSGGQLWRTATPEPACAWGAVNCAHALLAGVSVIPGVVFAGAMDGHERAYDAQSGHIIWDFDAGGEFDAVNGARGHGGAIDYGGQVIGAGMLFVNSGSMRQPGNLLLAFAPDGT
jgi:polyvinyl alcohol dehydrogenase (cytochrome)